MLEYSYSYLPFVLLGKVRHVVLMLAGLVPMLWRGMLKGKLHV